MLPFELGPAGPFQEFMRIATNLVHYNISIFSSFKKSVHYENDKCWQHRDCSMWLLWPGLASSLGQNYQMCDLFYKTSMF